MSLRRVYVALDPSDLHQLADEGRVEVDGRPARAVTAAVRRELAEVDEEEQEYDALLECAAAALERAGSSRRVVAAADLPEAAVHDVADGYAEVTLDGPLPRERLVSFHVDETTEHQDADLLWHDVTELEQVISLAEGR